MPDRINTKEAAAIIGINPNTLTDWRAQQRKNQPPFLKIGRKIFYLRRKVIAWVEEQEITFE